MRVHIVQKGDTLWKIAKQYGMGFDELKRLNAHLANPEYIVPGMEIMLPDTATPSKTKMTKEQQTAPISKEQQTAPMPTPQPEKFEEVKLVEEVIPQPMPEPIAEPTQEAIPEVTMPEKIKEQPIPAPPIPPQQPVMPMPFPQPSLQFDFSPQIHAYQQQAQPISIPIPIPMAMPQPMPMPMPQMQPMSIEQPHVQPNAEREDKKQEPMPMPETHVVYVPCIPHHYYHEPAPCGCSQPIMHLPCGCQEIQHPSYPPCGCQEMHYPYQTMAMPYYNQPYQEPAYQEPAYYESPHYNVAGGYENPYETEDKLPDWLLDSSSADLGASDNKKVDVRHVQQASVDHYDDVCPENEAQVADYHNHMDYYNPTGVMPAQNYPVQYDLMPQQYMPQSMPCGCNYNYPYFNQHSQHPHFSPWNY